MAIDQPIHFSDSSTEIPFLLLPQTDALFLDRALRLKNLAQGHAMSDYLTFVAEVAMAQHRILAAFPQTSLPPVATGQTPLAIGAFLRDPAWQNALRTITDEVSGKAPRDFSVRTKSLLSAASGSDLESWAQGYLEGDSSRCDIGMMPLVAAALQTYWTSLTGHLDSRAIKAHPAGRPANHCPVCDSPPVGSIVRAGAANQGLRYLVCSLCSSQWNMERIHCVSCGDSKHVFYYGIDGSDGAIQAETCDSCHVYSKIMHMEKNPAVDIIADDLATISLDILVGEAGYQRFGINPFLMTEFG